MKMSRLISRFAVLAAVHLALALPAQSAIQQGEDISENSPTCHGRLTLPSQMVSGARFITNYVLQGEDAKRWRGAHVVKRGNARLVVEGRTYVLNNVILQDDDDPAKVKEVLLTPEGEVICSRSATL